VDGKEIDVSELGNLIQATPKTAKVTVTSDGEHVVAGSGDKTIRIWGADSGKAIVRGVQDGVRFVEVQAGDEVQLKPDPRIEDLVKQAEAIKPGSGAQIRAALQGTPKPAGRVALRELPISPGKKPAVEFNLVKPAEKMAAALEMVQRVGGKKLIILSIEDGKVIQLKDQDLKRIIEKSIRSEIRDAPKGAASSQTKKGKVELDLHVVPSTSSETKAAPARSNEMDSLRRQLERISAELKALQQRLDAPRK